MVRQRKNPPYFLITSNPSLVQNSVAKFQYSAAKFPKTVGTASLSLSKLGSWLQNIRISRPVAVLKGLFLLREARAKVAYARTVPLRLDAVL